ncbi:glucan biosynthesis protein [Gallaecimonas sp. GXIMD1310]|uniref:glucan biosynthesis protein n=1 Tax=Gallaecimonas sp. GXIMD1310 TaxID=3131926 RepID=UPI003249A154
MRVRRPFWPWLLLAWLLASPAQAAVDQFAKDGPFTQDTVLNIARKLAQKPYQAPDVPLPASLQNLTYDQYRDIRFDPSQAIWAGTGLPYQMQLFMRGLYFHDPVEVAIVDEGEAHHLAYQPSMFNTGSVMTAPLPSSDIGFAGLRLHAPINRPDYYDEVAVFQGASYFRSLGKHQNYGLSARGLAIKTADPQGEEFPAFRAFWVVKPSNDSNAAVVYALLDSPSTTGAYRFTIRPGDNTVMDVEATLFPRVDMNKVGLAPATSMFMFSMNGRDDVDDFRPQVHDSDGLLMLNGKGERLWRPLANPSKLQVSAFADTAPLGFGLIQRERHFESYQDLEAHYENRPSLWVEPLGNWGKGAVTLVEIPSNSEIHDNIVAYWNPAETLKAGGEYSYSYRLNWGHEPATQTVKVVATRSGRADIKGPTPDRLFVIDYQDPQAAPAHLPEAQVSASDGTVSDVVVQANPHVHGYRLSFRLKPGSKPLSELRASLHFEDGRQSETWLYRWTPRS